MPQLTSQNDVAGFLGEVTEQFTLISLNDSHASSLWSQESRSKNHSQWSEITLVNHCRDGDQSHVLSYVRFLLLFILVDLSSRILSGTLSYLSAPGALPVSEQSEERRLLDTFRSHYFVRSTLARWWRSSRGNARNASHGHALLDDLFHPRVYSVHRTVASAKESMRKISLLLWQVLTINWRRVQSTRQFNLRRKTMTRLHL